MTLSDWLIVLAVLFFLCMAFFFSGSETALTASSRGTMLRLAKNGNASAVIVTRLLERRQRLIGALLIGNNVATIVSSALARWGSCNTRRDVRLAWRLVKAPRDLVDYVICHELAHLRHMNHSSAFWAEVARQCPDYLRLRTELFATDHLYRSF